VSAGTATDAGRTRAQIGGSTPRRTPRAREKEIAKVKGSLTIDNAPVAVTKPAVIHGIHLTAIEHAVYCLRMDGMPPVLVARELDIGRGAVVNMCNSDQPVGMAIHATNAALHAQLQERRAMYAQGALSTLQELASDPATEADVRLKAAEAILDRVGFPAETVARGELRATSVNVDVSGGAVSELFAQVGQLLAARRQVVTVEPVAALEEPAAPLVISAPEVVTGGGK
jgi:hypothetical protein